MPMNDLAVVIPGQGEIWIAPPGTELPLDLQAPEAPWDNLGHTSRDDGIGVTRDGGDKETLGSWQNPALRERSDPTTFAFLAHPLQADRNVYEMYFGPGTTPRPGWFGVTSAVATIEKALYIRIIDGANELPIYVPRTSISAEDDIEVDVEGFLAFPCRMGVLQITGSNLIELGIPELLNAAE